MKILFVADNFFPERNAAASRVYERARLWVEQGHEVTVITGAPNFPEGKVFPGYRNRWLFEEVIDGIRVVRVWSFIAANRGVAMRLVDFLSFMVTALWRVVRLRGRFDVICVTTPQFFAAVAAWLGARLRDIPLVIEVSDLWPASVTAVGAMRESFAIRLIERVELAMYHTARRVIVLTDSFKQNLIARGVPGAKIDVVMNGVDLDMFKSNGFATGGDPRPSGSSRPLVIGYLGTLGMAHDLENVLRAAKLLGSAPVKFLFVGPGAEREKLIAFARGESLLNVEFQDPRPKNQMPQLWSEIDVALVHLKNTPLFATVIPSKIFEAMAMAKPILLVAPEGEASAIVNQHRCGWVVAPASPERLSAQVKAILNAPEERRRMAESALAAAPTYSRRRQAEAYLKSLNAALAGA